MTIIELTANSNGQRRIESQSHRRSCWLDGYIEVPAHLEADVWASLGWCELTIEAGRLVGVTATERPEPEPVEPEPMTNEEAIMDMLADHEYRISMHEIGLTEGA